MCHHTVALVRASSPSLPLSPQVRDHNCPSYCVTLALDAGHAITDHCPRETLTERLTGAAALGSRAICTDRTGHLNGCIIGQALSVPLAMFNHDCSPSAYLSVVFRQGMPPTGLVKAVRQIPSGGPVTLSYIPIAAVPSRERRQQLSDAYGFLCSCRLCRDPGATDALLCAKRWRREGEMPESTAIEDQEPEETAVLQLLEGFYAALALDNLHFAEKSLEAAEAGAAAFEATHRCRILLNIAEVDLVAKQSVARWEDTRRTLVSASRALAAVTADPRLAPVAIDPVILARIYLLESWVHAQAGIDGGGEGGQAEEARVLEDDNKPPPAHLDLAVGIFEAHFGGEHPLTENARRFHHITTAQRRSFKSISP